MKKAQIINQIRKDSKAAPTDGNNTPTRLSVGDVVIHNRTEHFVARVNTSCASLYPVVTPYGNPENISPDSELEIVRQLGVNGLLDLLESETVVSTKASKKAKSNDEPKLGKLGGYLGHTVVSVIRTLGKAGWDFATTRAAFDRVGVAAADQTLRIQLKAGRDGNGSMADLSAKDLALLKGKTPKAKAAKKAKAAAAPAAEVDADGKPVAVTAPVA